MTATLGRRLLLVLPTVLFLPALAMPAIAQSNISFVARRDFPAGLNPQGVAPADFNGDGVFDLAIASGRTGDVSVLIGDGDGKFQPPASFATGDANSMSVVAGDFNRDGVQDLAVANNGGYNPATLGSVAVLIGNGDGTFQTAVNLAAGNRPHAVAIGDLNGDAALDLAVTNWESHDLSVLLGNDDGTFQPAVNLATGLTPSAVAIGDVNGDAVSDLAVANYVSYSVSVMLGTGDGTFQAAQEFRTGPHPFSVALGDLNGDAALDIAVANLGDSITKPFHGDVVILLGDGTGTFGAARGGFAPGFSPRNVVARDLDGDGPLDLAVAAIGSALYLKGNGDGTFLPAAIFPVASEPWFLAAADLNADGAIDLAVTNSSAASVSVLLGHGGGTFLEAPRFPIGTYPSFSATGDFDADGVVDLAVPISDGTVSMVLGNGDGTFQSPQSFTAVAFPGGAAAGDYNNDGALDLAITSLAFDGTVSILLGNGDGTLRPPVPYAVGIRPTYAAAGDFNHDGALDLVVPSEGSTSITGSNTLSVLLGNGDGTFQPKRVFPGGFGARNATVADVDGDGNLDFGIAYHDSGLLIGYGRGDGTFAIRGSATANSTMWIAFGDLNGDGLPDLVTSNDWEGGLYVRLNTGNQTFGPPALVRPGEIGTTEVVIGDFNADGALDLASANQRSNDVSVLQGNGDGTFQLPLTFGGGLGVVGIVLGDFNGDGRPDLGAVNGSSGMIAILINDTPIAPPPTFHELAVGKDGNGSGRVTSTSSPESWGQIDCGDTCTATYASGTTVTLTAQADTGSTFAGWSGCDDVSGNVCTVAMSEARWVTATFVLERFTLSVSKGGLGSGTVTSTSDPPSATQINCGVTCAASYDWNTAVTLTATPAFGNLFLGWSGCDSGSGSMCRVTMNRARSVTATFVGVTLTPRLF